MNWQERLLRLIAAKLLRAATSKSYPPFFRLMFMAVALEMSPVQGGMSTDLTLTPSDNVGASLTDSTTRRVAHFLTVSDSANSWADAVVKLPLNAYTDDINNWTESVIITVGMPKAIAEQLTLPTEAVTGIRRSTVQWQESVSLVRNDAELGYDLYVDQATGNDADNGLTLATAKATFAGIKGLLFSGCNVYVGDATYNDYIQDDIPSGDVDNYTRITAQTPRGVIFNGTNALNGVCYLLDKSYIRFTGIVFDANDKPNCVLTGTDTGDSGNPGCSYIEYINCKGTNCLNGTSGAFTSNGRSGQNHHILYRLCEASNSVGGLPQGTHGFYITSRNTVVEDCWAHDNSGHGIHQYRGGAGSIDNNIIRRCWVNDNGQWGMLLGGGRDNVAHSIIIIDNGWAGGGGGARIGYSYSDPNNQFYNLTIHRNTGIGCYVHDTTDPIVKNVISYGNTSNGVISDAGTVSGLIATNNVSTDPTWADPDTDDYNITSPTSNCRSTGANLSTIFTADYFNTVFVDPWDIGGVKASSVSANIQITASDSFSPSDSVRLVYGRNYLLTDSANSLADAIRGAYSRDNLRETVAKTLDVFDPYAPHIREELTFSDGVVIRMNTLMTIAETITCSDALRGSYNTVHWQDNAIATTSATISKTGADTLTFSDAVRIDYGFILSETLAFSDPGELELIEAGEYWLDAAAVTTFEPTGNTLSVSDSANNWADSVIITLGHNIQVNETVTFTDNWLIRYGLRPAETLSFTDAVAFRLETLFDIRETLTFSDAGAVSQIKTLAVSDLLVVFDTVEVLRSASIGFAESVNFADGIALNLGVLSHPSDTLTQTDRVAIGIGMILSETLEFSDDVIAAKLTSFPPFDDINHFQDSVRLLMDCLMPVTGQSLSQSDSILFSSTLHKTYSDSLSFSDAVALSKDLSVEDSFTVSDSVELSRFYGVTVSDQLVVSDSLALGIGILPRDTIPAMSDSILFARSFALSPIETLTFTDSVVLFVSQALVASDSFTVSDFVAVEIPPQAHLHVFDTNAAYTDSVSLESAVFSKVQISDSFTVTDHVELRYGTLSVWFPVWLDSQASTGYTGLDDVDTDLDVEIP